MTQFIDDARTFGVVIDQLMLNKIEQLTQLMLQWNQKINLTAITDTQQILYKHFLDSFSLVPLIEGSVIDVGTGAGFPAFPLKLALPDTAILMLDSLNKRINYLNQVIEQLCLKNITTLAQRAEIAAQDGRYREQFDCATARAVASLPVLCEYCLGFVKPGGVMYAMKGDISSEELTAGISAAKHLNAQFREIITVNIPQCGTRSIVVIKKLGRMPSNFPRKAGKPSKSPLF